MTGSVRSRVVLVGPGPATRGGIAQFNRHLAEALAGAGAEITVLALSPVYPSWTKPGRQDAIAPAPLPARVELARSHLVAWRPWTWLAAVRELRRVRAATVVFQWWHPMFAPCYAVIAAGARRFGARVAFVCHNAEPHERFLFARPLTWLALGRADALLVLSRAVAEAISLHMPRDRIVQLSHPPYTGLLAAADSTAQEKWRRRIGADGRSVVLFFGNVRPYKGLADLIGSFPEVRTAVPAVLAVAGTFFESVEDYRRQIADLGLEEDVKLFPEYVPDSDVAPLLGLADLVVLPYRSGSQTGIAPLAAALGRPVVATDAGGISESATTRVVRSGDPASLADAIVDSLRNPPRPDRPDATWGEWVEAILALAGDASVQNDDAM